MDSGRKKSKAKKLTQRRGWRRELAEAVGFLLDAAKSSFIQKHHIQPAIGRPETRDERSQIVCREGGRVGGNVGRVAVEGEDAESAANLGAAEGRRFGLTQGAEFAGATLDDSRRDLIGERSGTSAWTRRIGKDV